MMNEYYSPPARWTTKMHNIIKLQRTLFLHSVVSKRNEKMPNSIFNHANEANFIFYSTIIVSTTQHSRVAGFEMKFKLSFWSLYICFFSPSSIHHRKKTKFNTKCKRNARVLLHHPFDQSFITKCMRARFRVCASNIGKIHARLVGREGEKFSIISEKHEHSSKCRYRRRRCQIRHQIMMTARDICNPISTSFTSFLAFSSPPSAAFVSTQFSDEHWSVLKGTC